MTADFTGDGLSDVVQHVYAGVAQNGNRNYYNIYYVFIAKQDENGAISYYPPLQFRTQAQSTAPERWTSFVNMPSVADFDGDGLQDMAVPYIINGIENRISLHIIWGKDIASGSADNSIIASYNLAHSTIYPTYATADFDNDGISDIIIVERQGVNGSYDVHFFSDR